MSKAPITDAELFRIKNSCFAAAQDGRQIGWRCGLAFAHLDHAQPYRYASFAGGAAAGAGIACEAGGQCRRAGRLRFDFQHYTSMTPDELLQVEWLVNQQIMQNAEVKTDIMALDQALSTGAMALFGEKYGESVRVVSITDFSRELCGGTHVHRTGDIVCSRLFTKAASRLAFAALRPSPEWMRCNAFQLLTTQISKAGELLHVSDAGVMGQLEKLVETQRSLERQVEQLKTKFANSQVEKLEGRKFNGSIVLAEKLNEVDAKQLRTIADTLRNKWGSAVIVIASVNEGNVPIVCAVSKDLVGKVQAGKLIGELTKAMGGKGGGRPDMAERRG